MKFSCTKENLLYSLDVVSPLAQKHIHLPVLMNTHIVATESGVSISTTNLETAIRVQVRAKVEQTGSFTVPAKTLLDFVKLITTDQVELSLVNNELFIKAGSSSTKIKGIPADEYPVLPDVEEEHAYVISVENLKTAIEKTVFSVAKNEIRPELSGVFFSFFSERFKGLICASTDSYRLSEMRVVVEQGTEELVTCIVPARVAYEINRLLQLGKNHDGEERVRVWVSENQIAIRYDNFEMTNRLIEGNYPDYTQIIPDNFKTNATTNIEILKNKIKAASLFTTIGINAVSFDLNVSENNIGISSTSTQTGEHSSEIDAVLTGEENSILLNHRYVLDGLSHIETDDVEFCVNSKDAPCLFRGTGTNPYLYIVMPIRQ